jgi:hypothetical protein
MTMTSLPIMFYSVFDFEYEKLPQESVGGKESKGRYLMLDSSLYKIGLECVCFNDKLFVKWVGYALF